MLHAEVGSAVAEFAKIGYDLLQRLGLETRMKKDYLVPTVRRRNMLSSLLRGAAALHDGHPMRRGREKETLGRAKRQGQ